MLPSEEGFPRSFGSYMLLESFGRGGMGEVYLAKHGGLEGIERICVLKMLRQDRADEEYARRFLDEARLTVQLHHQNICHVFDVGQIGPHMYLAMDFIPGVHLAEVRTRLQKTGIVMEQRVALYTMSEVLDALDYAHRLAHPVTGAELHLVHRDISPQNIMMSFEGQVTLIDFGLAASALKTEETADNLVMGKVAYMSPEQARGEDLDGSCDQFAAAIVLYELLTGERFYGARGVHEIWQVVGQGGFVPPAWDRVPVELAPVLGRALAATPRERFPSCGAFKDAIDELRPASSQKEARALMRALFRKRIDDTRSTLARFAGVQVPALSSVSGPVRLGPVTGEMPVTPPPSVERPVAEPTQVVQRRGTNPSIDLTSSSSSSRVERGGRGLPPIAAVGALALGVVVAAWVVLDAPPDLPPEAPPDVASEVVPAPAPPPAVDVTAPPEPPEPEQVPPPPATAVDEDPPPPAPSGRLPVKPIRKRPASRDAPEAARMTSEAEPGVVVIRPVEPEPAPPPRIVRTKPVGTRAEELVEELTRCPLQCAKAATQAVAAKGGPASLKEGDLVMLSHCAERCRDG